MRREVREVELNARTEMVRRLKQEQNNLKALPETDLDQKNQKLTDLSWREIAVFAPLVVWAFWIGLNPEPFFRILERPVAQIVERVQPGYYAQHNLPNPLATPTAELR